MRRSTIVLALVFICSTFLAASMARIVLRQQLKIAHSRSQVSTAPLAGFQKFAASIQWILFIQHGGSRDVDQESAKDFYTRILRIIHNDPDFYKAYYTGVLMLGPVAPEYALDIANRGLMNERIRQHWQLPMLAGQLIMNKEKLKHYNNQPMDLQQLEKASGYFEEAKNSPGAGGIAMRSYIRSLAALKQDNRRLELKEIEAWYDYWRSSRNRMDRYGYRFSDDDSDRRDSAVESLLLSQMRVAKRRYPDDPEVEKLVDRIVREAFPDRRLDPVYLEPYGPGDRYSPHSGVKVEVYGICTSCEEVLKGPYCHACGTKAEAAEVLRAPATPTGGNGRMRR